jgi:hypothetical protein
MRACPDQPFFPGFAVAQFVAMVAHKSQGIGVVAEGQWGVSPC